MDGLDIVAQIIGVLVVVRFVWLPIFRKVRREVILRRAVNRLDTSANYADYPQLEKYPW